MTANPIETEYRAYFLTQRIEELRKLAISSKTTDMLRTMRELMGAVGCWHLEGGLIETIDKFCAYVQRKCKCHGIGHLPPLSVRFILKEWIIDDQSVPPMLCEPDWEVDDLYLFGWLAILALHEDYAPVDAWVEFSQYREEFVIHGMRWI